MPLLYDKHLQASILTLECLDWKPVKVLGLLVALEKNCFKIQITGKLHNTPLHHFFPTRITTRMRQEERKEHAYLGSSKDMKRKTKVGRQGFCFFSL